MALPVTPLDYEREDRPPVRYNCLRRRVVGSRSVQLVNTAGWVCGGPSESAAAHRELSV